MFVYSTPCLFASSLNFEIPVLHRYRIVKPTTQREVRGSDGNPSTEAACAGCPLLSGQVARPPRVLQHNAGVPWCSAPCRIPRPGPSSSNRRFRVISRFHFGVAGRLHVLLEIAYVITKLLFFFSLHNREKPTSCAVEISNQNSSLLYPGAFWHK